MRRKEQEAENTKGKETIKIKLGIIREHTMTVPKVGWGSGTRPATETKTSGVHTRVGLLTGDMDMGSVGQLTELMRTRPPTR